MKKAINVRDINHENKNKARIAPIPIPESTKDLGFFEARYNGKPMAKTAPIPIIKYPKYKIKSMRSNNNIII